MQSQCSLLSAEVQLYSVYSVYVSVDCSNKVFWYAQAVWKHQSYVVASYSIPTLIMRGASLLSLCAFAALRRLILLGSNKDGNLNHSLQISDQTLFSETSIHILCCLWELESLASRTSLSLHLDLEIFKKLRKSFLKHVKSSATRPSCCFTFLLHALFVTSCRACPTISLILRLTYHHHCLTTVRCTV